MKTCLSCEIEKPLVEFSFRNLAKGTKQSYCKTCQKIKSNNHYKENKVAYKIRVKQHRKEGYLSPGVVFIRQLKESNPCTDCNKYFPFYVMQFDHLENKLKDIARLVNGPMNVLVAELKKCELVCANCHAIRTYSRNHPPIAQLD